MRIALLISLLFLVGCGPLAGDDVDGTLVAGVSEFNTASAAMADQAIVWQTEMAATVVSAETQVAAYESVNDQLRATLAASSTATPALVVDQADPNLSSGEVIFGAGDRLFIKTGISSEIDPVTGCVLNPSTTYPLNTPRLYATFRAFNVAAGTPMRADWFYEGELRIQDNWTVPGTINEACLWFELDASRTEFTPGQWQVALYVDEQNFQLEDRMTYFIASN